MVACAVVVGFNVRCFVLGVVFAVVVSFAVVAGFAVFAGFPLMFALSSN